MMLFFNFWIFAWWTDLKKSYHFKKYWWMRRSSVNWVKSKSKQVSSVCGNYAAIKHWKVCPHSSHIPWCKARWTQPWKVIPNPLKSTRASNESFWRPNAFLFTCISISPSRCCPVFATDHPVLCKQEQARSMFPWLESRNRSFFYFWDIPSRP